LSGVLKGAQIVQILQDLRVHGDVMVVMVMVMVVVVVIQV
jgi:hypothetical protein